VIGTPKYSFSQRRDKLKANAWRSIPIHVEHLPRLECPVSEFDIPILDRFIKKGA
jgi:hypothetical protein